MKPFPSIAEVVPHSGRMSLLDEVVGFDGARLACRVTLRPDSTFVEAGRVDAVVTLEYMAQAVAAFAGMNGRARGQPVRIGYLLGSREFVLGADLLAVGDVLLVEVAHVWDADQLGVFDCSVTRDGIRIASAALSVYQGTLEERPS